MISLLHSAEVCALFPTRLDRLHFVSRTTWCLRRRMTETQSFRSASTLRSGRPYHLHTLHLLVYHCKSSHDLVNYARAHNSMWLHTKVSSLNNLMIPLSLGHGPETDRQSQNTQVPQSTQMCVKVATLSKPLINNLTSVMKYSQTQSTSTSIAQQYKQRNSNSQGLNAGQQVPTSSTTSQYPHVINPTHAMFEGCK